MKRGLVTWQGDPNGITGDQPLVDALARRGHSVAWLVWDDPSVSWSDFDLIVLRTTWDYHLRSDDFLAWIAHVSKKVAMRNTPELINWNAHKSYLLTLADAGVSVIKTRLVRKGEPVVLSDLSWVEIVAKPAISAEAHRTARLNINDSEAQAFVNDLAADCDVLIQPYLPEVGEHGETSMIFIDGELVTTVRRDSALLHGIEAADKGMGREPLPEEGPLRPTPSPS